MHHDEIYSLLHPIRRVHGDASRSPAKLLWHGRRLEHRGNVILRPAIQSLASEDLVLCFDPWRQSRACWPTRSDRSHWSSRIRHGSSAHARYLLIPDPALGWDAVDVPAEQLPHRAVKTWKLTPDQKVRLAWRYRRGEPVKTIADDYSICTKAVCRVAWSRGAMRRTKARHDSR